MKYPILILAFLMFSCNNKKEVVIPEDTPPTDTIAPPKIADKLLVQPGKGIGNIALLQNSKTLEVVLGKPDLSDAAMGKAWLTWFSKVSDTVTGNELNIYTTYKDNNMTETVVRQIRITSNEFKTQDGVSTGKSLEKIKLSYPNLELIGKYDVETNTPVSVYDDVGSGIAFEFEHDVCAGIIIHEKGQKVSKNYLSFHPDMKPM